MQPGEFDQLVEAAFRRIPAQFRKRMANVALIVEPEPPPGRVGPGYTLFGLYEGRPLTHRSVFESIAMPDHITIFQGPHERLARSPEQLASMVEDTVWHEVGHYFGMSEAQVRAAQRRRRGKR